MRHYYSMGILEDFTGLLFGDFSAIMITFGGILLGFIFLDLMKEVGWKREKSPINFLIAPFLAFASVILFQLLFLGNFSFVSVDRFQTSPMFAFSIALLIGGLLGMLVSRVKKG